MVTPLKMTRYFREPKLLTAYTNAYNGILAVVPGFKDRIPEFVDNEAALDVLITKVGNLYCMMLVARCVFALLRLKMLPMPLAKLTLAISVRKVCSI
jgi:hypothetical protein